jgi:hypothetical protein
MHALLDLDKAQLDRLNQAIAMVSRLPAQQRERKLYLLQALEAERQDLIRCNPAIRSAFKIVSAAA